MGLSSLSVISRMTTDFHHNLYTNKVLVHLKDKFLRELGIEAKGI